MNEPVVFSGIETDRFGLRIGRTRLESDIGMSDRIAQSIGEQMLDITVLRVPAGAHTTVSALADSGFQVLHADTLVYYRLPLPVDSSPTPVGIGAEVVFRLADASDVAELQHIARDGFGGYRSHYNANRRLPPDQILEGYIQWACAYLAAGQTDRFTCLAVSGTDAAGFLTCSIDSKIQQCEVVLNAVHPAHAGKGIYTKGLTWIAAYAYERGCKELIISTQVWNYRVQQVWARLGFSLFNAYDTYHVMPSKSASALSLTTHGLS
ncbi:GNAT family N-acetyltransferase [Xanthomonas campestris]|uniref:GNAT family N-acetyltransferase n=1 Tax=Xanthomonas campestris TaxID=339 RepID=UPI0012901873|nr:GNAT family N-acetyltransferase [Xanthomonas campestris]